MLSILFAPFWLLAACIILFLIVTPIMLIDDRRRGTEWTRTRKLLAAVSGVLFVLVAGLIAWAYAIGRGA